MESSSSPIQIRFKEVKKISLNFEDTKAWWEGFECIRMKSVRIRIQTAPRWGCSKRVCAAAYAHRDVSRCSPSLERCPRLPLFLSLIAAASATMSHSSVAKRKHPPARADPSKRTRSASSFIPSDDLALFDLEYQVHHLGAKVVTFRQKGLPFFARLSQERAQPNPEGDGKVDTTPTESKNAQEDLRQVLKERLAAANLMLPTLLEELVMWNTKIHQAVDVKRKHQRLPFLDDEENGI